MKTEIIEQITVYLKNEILQQPDREITANEAIISSGLIDSFSLVDVALFIEDTFGVTIDDTELNAETFDTLDALADLVIARKED